MRNGKRLWEVIRLRAKGEVITVVTAADDQAAIKLVVKQYEIAPEDARWLIARPCE